MTKKHARYINQAEKLKSKGKKKKKKKIKALVNYYSLQKSHLLALCAE